MDTDQAEIDRLHATIRVLEEENAMLAERAEDAMLLGLVAEAIEGLTEPAEVIDHVVERISILKNLPFVTCGSLDNGKVEKIASYAAFSDDPTSGYPIELSLEVLRDLNEGPYLTESLDDLSTSLNQEIFSPRSVLVIPFHCHYYGHGVFIFYDGHTGRYHLASMLFLLDQVVRLTTSRLDNIYLGQELMVLNSELETRVALKTEDLLATNIRLKQVYNRFVSVLNGIDSYVHVTDTNNFTILFANQKAKDLFGETVEGQKCHQVLRQENIPCAFCKIPRLLAAEKSTDKVITWQSFNPRIGRWILNSEQIVDWPDVPAALLTVGTDITDLKRTEEEKQQLTQRLHQVQKMEAIGVLAGSIAHDLNNILTGIVSYPDLLLAKMPEEAPLRKPLETIRSAGVKAANIVQGLLSLSRRSMQIEEAVDLGQLVSDYLESPEYRDLRQHHPGIRTVVPVAQKDLVVLGSPTHLSNVLMNLVNNAAEAIPDDGLITIGLEKIDLTDQPPGFQTWRPGAYARLMVRDTGGGIPKEYQERIFEPFFTRKEVGRSGTGLGLAIVWGTVTDHRGYIEVSSIEGQGTCFHVYLPLADHSKPQEKSSEIRAVFGQGQSILVVDDEEQQRQIASEILIHLGYNARVAESGEAAILLLQKTPFDLVILDMIMAPGIDGLETYKRIRALLPGQKAIIASGFSQSEKALESKALGIIDFVQKPYSLNKISKVVHTALTQ